MRRLTIWRRDIALHKIMTKYILNSGGITSSVEKAIKFYTEMVSDLGANPKILMCYFAQPREYWEMKFADDQVNLLKYFPENIKPTFTLAFPNKFIDQINETNVVFIRGGDDHLIKYWLKQFDLPNIWNNKVVVGSSAGSHVLSTHFWTCDWRECMDGLGILPIKFLAHFKSDYGSVDPRGPVDWDSGFIELRDYKNTNLPIHAPEEGDYVVIEQ